MPRLREVCLKRSPGGCVVLRKEAPMKIWINGLITAAISGGAAAALVVASDPQHLDFQKTAMLFGAGAIIGILNWLRKNPWHYPPSKIPEDGEQATVNK